MSLGKLLLYLFGRGSGADAEPSSKQVTDGISNASAMELDISNDNELRACVSKVRKSRSMTDTVRFLTKGACLRGVLER